MDLIVIKQGLITVDVQEFKSHQGLSGGYNPGFSGSVKIQVFDVAGRLVRGLADEGAAYQEGDGGRWKVANTANCLTDGPRVRELGQLAGFPDGGDG